MRSIVQTMAFLLALGLIAVPVAIAQPNGPASQAPLPQTTHGRGFEKLAAQLGLTPDQETTFKGLHQEFRNETAGIRDSLHAKRQELSALFKDPKAQDADIMAKKQELSALQNQIDQKAMEYGLKARKVLTPDQLAKVPPGFLMGMGMGLGHGMGPKGPPSP
jgi:Spy/CpxP family protein refolding chaperone